LRTKDRPRSGCPIASTLDILGDRWSLVIIRDMVTGKTRFGDFLKSPERIPTNILTERLQRLEAFGLIEKERYQQNPVRFAYRLTRKGADLLPALQAVCIWANRHLPETWRPPKTFLALKPDDITRANRAASKS
jgi:DNA-binding HxlR family transcriptional regulator